MSNLGNKEIMSTNIKRLMKRKNVTRTQMADDLSLKYTTLTDWINGKTYPRIDNIEKMATYFKVSKSDLVENYDPNPVEPVDLDKALSEEGMAMFDGKPLSEEYKKALLAMLRANKNSGD